MITPRTSVDMSKSEFFSLLGNRFIVVYKDKFMAKFKDLETAFEYARLVAQPMDQVQKGQLRIFDGATYQFLNVLF